MGGIKIEVWLYGPLSRFAGEGKETSHAQVLLDMEPEARVGDVLARLGLPLEEKGITFINGQLTDMPGLGADFERVLNDGDRVAFFHRKSMWPFQYRFGASTSAEFSDALQRAGGTLVHTPKSRIQDAGDVAAGEGGEEPDSRSSQ